MALVAMPCSARSFDPTFLSGRVALMRVSVRLDKTSTVRRADRNEFFDNARAFVLDIRRISPIIYIWYEGGWLSPPVVTGHVVRRG